jgi:hypothetical protein
MHARARAVFRAGDPGRIASFPNYSYPRTCNTWYASLQRPTAYIFPRRRIGATLFEFSRRRRGTGWRTIPARNAGSHIFFFHAAEIPASALFVSRATSRREVAYGHFHLFGRNSVPADLSSRKLEEEK